MILDETFDAIKSKTQIDELKIDDIFLSNFFNVIQLSDSSVGACLNYLEFKTDKEILVTRNLLKRRIKSDPLLTEHLFGKDTNNLLKLNLRTCLVSALSRNLIIEKSGFKVRKRIDTSIFSGSESATVLGLGGFMDFIIKDTPIMKIHIADLSYDKRKREMDRIILMYKKGHPNKVISISNGHDNRERTGSADLVSITGSAFCNGTMDELLHFSRGCKRIIVQGQSASVYPEVLFKHGVSLVATTIKPKNLIQTAFEDFQEFRNILEGGLPWIYITPKNER